jgi:hypothetical protein
MPDYNRIDKTGWFIGLVLAARESGDRREGVPKRAREDSGWNHRAILVE